MPKVIHVLRKFEPAAWGGIETHLCGLIPELARRGWTSEVHAPREAGTDGVALERLGARFVTFRAHYPYLNLDARARAGLVASSGNLVAPGELARLMANAGVDVLHVHTLGRLGGVVRTAARLRGLPYAVTLHGPVRAGAEVIAADTARRTRGLVDLGAPFGWAVGARKVVRDADIVFVLNRAEQDAWRANRNGRHLERVSHGVDARQADDAQRRELYARIPGLKRPFVAVVARLERPKGHDVAIEAFARAAPPGISLCIAGAPVDEAYSRDLHDLARRLGRDIVFAGGLPPASARALLAEATLVVIPSRAEPFGIVLLEAWAEGAPAIYSAASGLADIAARAGAGAGIAPVNDVDTWARRITDALEDARWRHAESLAGPVRVRNHFTWAALAETTIASYRRFMRTNREANVAS